MDRARALHSAPPHFDSDKETDTAENITFPQLDWRVVIFKKRFGTYKLKLMSTSGNLNKTPKKKDRLHQIHFSIFLCPDKHTK